jgi:hypothetical protein
VRTSGASAASAYSVVTWDDETGDAEILEYDADDQLIRRQEWRHAPGAPTPGRVVGEVQTFDAAGKLVESRPLTWREGKPGSST